MYVATVMHRRWLWLVKFALESLEGAVATVLGTPDLSHIPTGRGRMELKGPVIRGGGGGKQ
jgi:hypothetical protein